MWGARETRGCAPGLHMGPGAPSRPENRAWVGAGRRAHHGAGLCAGPASRTAQKARGRAGARGKGALPWVARPLSAGRRAPVKAAGVKVRACRPGARPGADGTRTVRRAQVSSPYSAHWPVV